jgi:hypothetical protein
MKTETQLLELKKEVETAKTRSAELTGQQKAVDKQFKDDWQCNSIETAKKKLVDKDNDIAVLDKKIKDGVKELEEKYNIE